MAIRMNISSMVRKCRGNIIRNILWAGSIFIMDENTMYIIKRKKGRNKQWARL